MTKNSGYYFLRGGGEMGKLIRAKDWSKTALGDPANWPQSLRTMVAVMLDNPFGMYIAWGKEYIQLYNDRYRPILGATKHPQALGISARETFSEIWHIIESMFDGVMDGVAVGFPDFMLPLDRNGYVETCYFDFAYSPIRLDNGQVGGILVTVTETTNKKKAEDELNESKNQLEFAIDAAQLGTFDYNPITNKFTANNRLKRWFGLPSDEHIELTNAMSVIQEGDRVRVSKAIENALQYDSGGKYDVVYTIINPITKKETIVHAKGKTWFNEQNLAYRLTGTLEDVTEQILAQRKIIESESNLKLMISQAPVAIAIFRGMEYRVEIANKHALELWGRTEQQVLGKPVFSSMPELLSQGIKELLDEVRSTGNRFATSELPVQLLRNGVMETVYINFSYEPLYDAEKNINGIMALGFDVTPQAEARKKVEDSEKRYNLMLMQSPFAFLILKGKDMVVHLANESMKEVLGKGNDIEGKPLIEVLPEIKGQAFPSLLDKVYNTGIPYSANEMLAQLTRNDKLVDVYFNFVYQPYYEADNTISGVTVIAYDVTSSVIANKKIEESEKQFITLANNIQNLAWIADSKGYIFWYNQRWYDYTGTTHEEMKGWGWEKVHHPDHVDRVVNFVKRAWLRNKPWELTFPLRNANGEYRWFLTLAFPVTNEEGEIVNWIGTNTDITEQKSFEEQLKEKVNERTKELHQANEELQRKNQEIALSKYNKRFLIEFSEKFSQYKLYNEFFSSVVTYIADLTHLDYVFIGRLQQSDSDIFSIQTIALSAFGKLVDNINYPLPDGPCEQIIIGTVYSYPSQCQQTFPKNETIKQFNVEGYLGYPLFDGEGNAIGLIAVMHERKIEDPETVTSILRIVAKRAEIEMERIKNEELLKQNNKILEEKNQELLKINKELESFTYISSHDLQEPLRKIQTFASRIKDKEENNLTDYGKDMFNRMQGAAKRMQTLIQDLLAYSRTNTNERRFVTTDLNEIVAEVKEDLNEELKEKEATIEANHLCDADVIPFQFRQLLINLIGNSLKFANPETSPHIKIKSKIAKGIKFNHEKLSPQNKYCRITVSDNGIGFEQQYNEKIFEVFQRLHGKNEYIGTGIGLSIVKKIVENHHGYITATSELKKGATFDIYIPAT